MLGVQVGMAAEKILEAHHASADAHSCQQCQWPNTQKRFEWAENYRNVQFHKWVDVDRKWVSCYKPMGKFKMPTDMKCPQST